MEKENPVRVSDDPQNKPTRNTTLPTLHSTIILRKVTTTTIRERQNSFRGVLT
jgi:hypothetical protein